MTNNKFGFPDAKNPDSSEAAPAADLSDFQPGEPHTPDPTTEAEMDRRAADAGFPPRHPAEHSANEPAPPPTGHRRRRPKEPATQITLHAPRRVATRFANFCDEHNFPSYWSALEHLMNKADVPD